MRRIALAFLAALLSVPALAQESVVESAAERVVEPVAPLVIPRRVSAAHTPSGLPVPRYVSLKYGRTHGRSGPSRNHSIRWTYNRRGLPLVVVAETEQWRRVRDPSGDESWIRSTGLSGERHALVAGPTEMRRNPDIASRARLRLPEGALVALGSCRGGWCEVETEGRSGWAMQSRLWGAAGL